MRGDPVFGSVSAGIAALTSVVSDRFITLSIYETLTTIYPSLQRKLKTVHDTRFTRAVVTGYYRRYRITLLSSEVHD